MIDKIELIKCEKLPILDKKSENEKYLIYQFSQLIDIFYYSFSINYFDE